MQPIFLFDLIFYVWVNASEARTRGPLSLESSTLSLSHCAPPDQMPQNSNVASDQGFHCLLSQFSIRIVIKIKNFNILAIPLMNLKIFDTVQNVMNNRNISSSWLSSLARAMHFKQHSPVVTLYCKSGNFVWILYSQIALKDIFVKIHD